MTNDIHTIAHVSDLHLGYEAYSALTNTGDNQRAFDIVKAAHRVITDIIQWDPDMVIIAGDVFDRAKVEYRYVLAFQQMLTHLAKRENGTTRPVVIISGNHDASPSRKDVCALELYREMDGIYVRTQGYSQVDLGSTVVHTIPHDSLKEIDFDEVKPVKGKRNVLTSHGVAHGSELFLQAKGREFPIPSYVMLRDWTYVALGHYHKQGEVVLSDTTYDRIWYSGSAENISFRDLKTDASMNRGYLRVTVGDTDADPLTIAAADVPIRSMYRLSALDGEGMDAKQISQELLERVNAAPLDGAVVEQIVTGVPRDVLALCDLVPVRVQAAQALHYQLTIRPYRPDTSTVVDPGTGLGQINELVGQYVELHAPQAIAEEVTTKTNSLLESSQESVVGTSE